MERPKEKPRVGAQAKLTAEDVKAIRQRFDEGESYTTLARAFNVHHQTIGRIVRRESWAHVS